jgi:GTP-sensing pleiotropic transcriptional regulator CodY
LTKKIFAYVKDEGAHFNTMTTTLKSIISCETLCVMENFQGTSFGYGFTKACQYATSKKRNFGSLKYVAIKCAQI